MSDFPTCRWCNEQFITPEGLQQHVVSCSKRPAATGKRKPTKGER